VHVTQQWRELARSRRAWRRFRDTDRCLQLVEQMVSSGQVVVDVGAERGLYTTGLADRVGRSGHVHAFEPNPANFEHLRLVTGRRRNVTLHPVALSDHSSAGVLRVPLIGSLQHGMGSLETEFSGVEHEEVHVDVRPLDEVLSPGTRVSFLKCDVEGHEGSVLRGAEQTLTRSLPAILVEIEQRHQQADITETFGFLDSLGYQGHVVAAEGLRPLEGFDVQRDQLDLLGPDLEPQPSGEYLNNFLFTRPGAAPAPA
jgi:FkbM family methyltransferase